MPENCAVSARGSPPTISTLPGCKIMYVSAGRVYGVCGFARRWAAPDKAVGHPAWSKRPNRASTTTAVAARMGGLRSMSVSYGRCCVARSAWMIAASTSAVACSSRFLCRHNWSALIKCCWRPPKCCSTRRAIWSRLGGLINGRTQKRAIRYKRHRVHKLSKTILRIGRR